MRIQFRSLALGFALSTVVGAARADVIVTGTLDNLHIEASRAPILAVLEALKKQFGIVYRSRARPDWTVDGTFTGSLSSILPRVFRDKDYVFRIDAHHSMTLFLPSRQGPPSVAPNPLPVQAFRSESSDEQARRRWANPPDPPDDEAPEPSDTASP
jgi:hypothetical protein